MSKILLRVLLKSNLFPARRFNLSTKLLSVDKAKFERPQPILMSYNIYNSSAYNADLSPVIIMHGLFGSKSNWNSLSKAINNQTGRKVITVDARNHGESPHSDDFSYFHLVEDIHNLLGILNIPKACILGHSMGGRAMMLFSIIYPELVEKLIVVDISHKSPGSQMTGMSKYFKAMKDVEFKNDLSMPDARKKANDELSTSIPELDIRQFLLTNLVKDQNQFKWRLNINILEKAFSSEITEFPETSIPYTGPTLFIGGMKSSYLRKEDHIEIKKKFPNAIFEYLDAGHWVHAERPNEFLKTVRDFLV